MRRRGLTLRLRRQPDPVIEEDELRCVYDVLSEELVNIEREMSDRLVSESVIRRRYYLELVLPKIKMVLDSYRA